MVTTLSFSFSAASANVAPAARDVVIGIVHIEDDAMGLAKREILADLRSRLFKCLDHLGVDRGNPDNHGAECSLR